MGDGGAVFEALGIDFDAGTLEGLTNYYGTRYLIWANEDNGVGGLKIGGTVPAALAEYLIHQKAGADGGALPLEVFSQDLLGGLVGPDERSVGPSTPTTVPFPKARRPSFTTIWAPSPAPTNSY